VLLSDGLVDCVWLDVMVVVRRWLDEALAVTLVVGDCVRKVVVACVGVPETDALGD
jgi:hypothetical protein